VLGEVSLPDQVETQRRFSSEKIGDRRNAADPSDKAHSWQDLIRLTQDEDSEVRTYAYHTLGKASISKAAEAKDRGTLKSELSAAVIYFEKSHQESAWCPASFCHPFYRAYLAISSQEAKGDEVQRYLAQAKNAVVDNYTYETEVKDPVKDELFKAVENLARALQESQRLKDKPFREIANELNTYRWYCEKAAEHMAAAEGKAPGAVKAMRKCNPLLEERIQSTLAEIQEKAKQICRITHGSGTVFESPGAEINRAAKALSSEDIFRTQESVFRIASQLKEFCRLLPEGKRELVCSIVKEIELATEFPNKLDKIELAFAYVSSAVETALQSRDVCSDIKQVHSDIKQVLTEVGVVNNKLDEIRYAIFKQRISSRNAISNLTSIRTELEKLYQFSQTHPESSLEELYSCREEQLQELSKDLDDRFAELKSVLERKASTDEVKIILDKLELLKPAETWNSKIWNMTDKGATLLSYVSFLQDAIPILRPLMIG